MEIDISKIQPNRYNPKITEEHEEKFQIIKAGIEEMGMKSPIDVREIDGPIPYEIIDGYHRWKACSELGWKTILISSWGKINEDQAKKITILKEKAHIPLDLIKTAEILSQLAKDTSLEELARQVGYSIPQLEEDLKLVGFEWSQYNLNKDKQGELDKGNSEVRTFSVVMTLEQYEIVINAMTRAKQEGQTESDGRALELICAEFLSGH